MRIVIFVTIIILSLSSGKGFSQTPDIRNFDTRLKLHSKENASMSNGLAEAILIVFPLNPILQIQNKKFYAGITKEVSLLAYPFGRFAVEYSLIFRSTKLNQLRASYNYDIALETGDFYALLLSVGGGVFTDFEDTGYFPQAALSILLPVTESFGAVPYFKLRYTFITNSDNSGISDLSFGMATYILF